MAQVNNVRSFRKAIREMGIGETFYYNAVAGTSSMIDLARTLIANGTIAPVIEELEKHVTKESLDQYMSGEFIFPQMEYRKMH